LGLTTLSPVGGNHYSVPPPPLFFCFTCQHIKFFLGGGGWVGSPQPPPTCVWGTCWSFFVLLFLFGCCGAPPLFFCPPAETMRFFNTRELCVPFGLIWAQHFFPVLRLFFCFSKTSPTTKKNPKNNTNITTKPQRRHQKKKQHPKFTSQGGVLGGLFSRAAGLFFFFFFFCFPPLKIFLFLVGLFFNNRSANPPPPKPSVVHPPPPMASRPERPRLSHGQICGCPTTPPTGTQPRVGQCVIWGSHICFYGKLLF